MKKLVLLVAVITVFASCGSNNDCPNENCDSTATAVDSSISVALEAPAVDSVNTDTIAK